MPSYLALQYFAHIITIYHPLIMLESNGVGVGGNQKGEKYVAAIDVDS